MTSCPQWTQNETNKRNVFSRTNEVIQTKQTVKETKILRLDSNKALKKLNWKTFLSLSELSFYISEWYVAYYSKEKKMLNLSLNQINNYEKKVFK